MGGDEFERTFHYGERAFRHLRENGISASPLNYELWYTYAAGSNQLLNSCIDEYVATRGAVDSRATAELHGRFLSRTGLQDKVDAVSSDVSTRIHDVLQILENSEKSVGDFGETLRRASDGLVSAETGAQARTIVERIIAATAEAQARNVELEQKLADSRSQIEGLHKSLETVRFESLTDPLTNLANRRAFDESLERAAAHSRASGRPLCLAMCDIDHFKRFNDSYGHLTGDQILRLVGATIGAAVGEADLVARYGGEEFAIIMTDCDLQRAIRQAEALRLAVADCELVKKSTGQSLGRVTLSGGVTLYNPDESLSAFVERADRLLYEAKNSGRNRIVARRPSAGSPQIAGAAAAPLRVAATGG